MVLVFWGGELFCSTGVGLGVVCYSVVQVLVWGGELFCGTGIGLGRGVILRYMY